MKCHQLQHFISMCEKLCKHCAILSFIRYIKKIKLSKNLKKKLRKAKNDDEEENSRKVYHFFFGSLEIKGYLNVYIIHKKIIT